MTAGLPAILGHEAVRSRLWSALAEDRAHHAYLFEGPRGSGKRLVADRFAMAANCTSGGEELPCGQCPTCRTIAAGHHPDLLVLVPDPERAARTIPIEAVREVIRQTTYHRYSARKRVVIVDPVDAMQEPAANALLKTLEEPPDGTHFLLVSHNPAGLLPTIRSRCQRIRFGAVAVEDVARWLVEVHGKDPVDADAASRVSSGCPGRALELVGDGLLARAALRNDLLRALGGPFEASGELASRLTQGARQEWSTGVGDFLEVVEDLLRDAAIVATGAQVPTTAADTDLERVADLYPDGLERCARAMQDARDDLEVYVSGKTVLEALLTTIRRELGR